MIAEASLKEKITMPEELCIPNYFFIANFFYKLYNRRNLFAEMKI